MRTLFFTLLLSLFIFGSAYAEPPETVTGNDGTVYELMVEPVEEPAPVVKLKPGESIRVGEACDRVKFDWLHVKTICTWDEEIRATADGLEKLPGSSEDTPTVLNLLVVIALISIVIMLVAMLVVFFHTAIAALVAIPATAIPATIAAATIAVAIPAAIAAIAAVAAAAVALAAAVEKSKKWFYFFGSVYIAFMGYVVYAAPAV